MSQPTRPRRRIHQAAPPVAPMVRRAVAEAIAAVAPVRKDKALPLLQQIQARLGSLPAPALACASRVSRIPLADLNALVSFYDLLAADDDGGVVIHVCDDLICRHAAGAGALAERLRALGCRVAQAPCLGQCDRAPAALETRPVPADADPTPLPHTYGGYASWTLHADAATRRGWPDGYTPLLLARCGQYTDMPGYRAAGGLHALATAHTLQPAALVALVKSSKLIGRGGAAFPTGTKWEGVLNAPTPLGPGPDGALKYVVVNADESEPGTFTNRMLMEDDPFGVVEAALIAAHAVGAQQIYIYIRGEYPLAIERVHAAIHAFHHAGLAGAVSLEVRCGGGRYICGEETALFASIEGERGTPRVKPPFP
ncbi:MAG: putative formate dehydrogenase beta subunit, partial [Firmicutes bacterium]|nr:putative formate dehydrogenase beta subunit [Bacillota bacterium]